MDEIVLLDMSATPESRGPDPEVLSMLSRHCFVPLTVGGGIRSADDVYRVIRSGADKAAVNTHAVERPELLTEIADSFGVQCVVLSMDCRREADGTHLVYTRSGTVPTGMTAPEWAKKAEALGAGESFSIPSTDGSKQGYDLDLIRSVTDAVTIPVIACGGVGKFSDFAPAVLEGGASAAAAANIFHFIEHSTIVAKAQMLRGVDVRLDSDAYTDREFSEEGRLMLPLEKLLDIQLAPRERDLL